MFFVSHHLHNGDMITLINFSSLLSPLSFLQVKLTDALMSGTVFAAGKDAELAWVDGQIRLNLDTPDGIPVLDTLPQKQVRVKM